MQQELFEVSKHILPDSAPQPHQTVQHGLQHHGFNGSARRSLLQQLSDGMSPRSERGDSAIDDGEGVVNLDTLHERLRRLNDVHEEPNATQTIAPGQRISEYENALTPAVPRQALGFKVIKRADTRSDGVQLSDMPNEILTHILSHLHPDSHAAVSLVSKRFYDLVTTPHAWRMAFQRFFPGQDALATTGKHQNGIWGEEDPDIVRSEVRHFTRLALHSSWRSEYLRRTQLLRSLVRGKPGTNSGSIGSSSRSSQSGKKASAVLTYNTKLMSVVTHIHATFKPSGKKPPRLIHGASDMGIGTLSDPTSGKVEKWGIDDHFGFDQLEEVVPNFLPYGIGEGPAAVPNVMDVSQPYGLLGGEGFPGGRVFYRATNEYRGKYLGQDAGLVEAYPDIPKIPGMSEGVCCVWIAKSPSVPSATQSLVGIMTGSSLGVVTAFALGYDPTGPRYAPGEVSARWVLSPGVPIIALKIDDSYSQKRKALSRVWAVALNALGEVYYLTQPPIAPTSKTKTDDSLKLAWHTGRSTYWHLVEATRRQARPDESGRNALRGAYSPRSPSDDMNLTKDQMAAEAREIEKFLRYKPAHFRKVCYGWDMRRKLEVDFASDDEHGAGESVFIIDCGLEEDQTSAIKRLSRSALSRTQLSTQPTPEPELPVVVSPAPSIFGDSSTRSSSPNSSGSPLLKQVLSVSDKASALPATTGAANPSLDDWRETFFYSKELSNSQITATGADSSQLALITSFEDPLKNIGSVTSSNPSAPTRQAPSDIPGRRARLFGVGTNKGKVILWNMREAHASDGIYPVRVIQTESPEISCLALSALYLVHGGSDGLVQAWDPLASTLDPIRTINSRSPGRMPRHLLAVNPALRNSNFAAAGAIYLDPDPGLLHGVVSFGTFVRYWSYSSSNHATGRKRRHRHSDIQGRVAGRRHGGGVAGYIAAEAEELRSEQEHKAREQARLRSRFGVGLGELTEEEAIRYAEMVSQESFLLDEQRRTSASDTGSAADFDTTSSSGSTLTPDPSVTGPSPLAASSSARNETADESDYELQIQAAIRLSLMEGVNDTEGSPKASGSGEYDSPFVIKDNSGKKSSSLPSSSHTPMVKPAETSKAVATGSKAGADDDLEFALQLSLAEEESRKSSMAVLMDREDEFPSLGGSGFGKGKGKVV
ncbi:uncharacterized protein GGS22DRAFT_152983 [Annulohypoxylon maeteangense]|uniref:uncharacterized protein n=1 Tax=Annulohypoxylon maeteangense TaxID=1927788 RepID=UPI0020082406|nr:uncharacterized protein GGS22DRAFT_152983 [Annulohypoxylon maeteangense]KAI0889041.1 hypothetical protein GGS22DRAFT_152983 [Annulohypoxylon maeteangense]